MTLSIEKTTVPRAARSAAAGERMTAAEFLNAAAALFKIRVVGLLLFAGAGGAFLAARGWPGILPLLMMTLTGGLAAMGASAINQYLEQDNDALMRRTRRRPLVTGAIDHPGWVPFVALALIFVPSLAVAPFNPALAFFSIGGAAIYVGVYTIWLKPRTVLNIVIGGLAGSFAVFSGGAAVGPSARFAAQGWNDPGVMALGLLVFLWTPMHFWSLALVCREDYARANVPMLPARTSPRASAWWVMVHALGTGAAALALGAHATLGWLYLVPVALATGDMLIRCVRLIVHPSTAQARSSFVASNLYLGVILLMICLAALL